MPHALQQITEQREQARENERERYWSATRQIFTSSLVCAALWDLPFIMPAAWIRSQCKHYRTEIWQALPVDAEVQICLYHADCALRYGSGDFLLFCWLTTKANRIAEFIRQLTDDPDKFVQHKHSRLITQSFHASGLISLLALRCYV